jgi:Zn-dependent metalloprotease
LALHHHALDRRISDANSQLNVGTLVRTNGQPPTGIVDVDTAYDFLGDTYNFYFTHFQRDGIDETGGAILATVRYGTAPDAFWDGFRLFVSPGEGTDDTIGHEATHGVTQYDSALIYANESGAINESISDIFGEFIDLSNPGGNDDLTNRWMLFEDSQLGAFRSMKDPPVLDQPDWLGSTNYYVGGFDNGGVHINSGIPNKLCYLLTDGDTFRGCTVQGLGITNVAALFYEANHNLLVATSGWEDLTRALRQAALNLGWNGAQRANLETAMFAVGFRGSPPPNIFIDRLAVGLETGDYATPAHSMSKALELLGTATNGTFFVKGIGQTNRLARPLTIMAWDGTARLEP